MSLVDFLALVLATLGTFFFCAGAIGLVRLPDVYSRLHALSKADNLGLGLIVIALMLLADSWERRRQPGDRCTAELSQL